MNKHRKIMDKHRFLRKGKRDRHIKPLLLSMDSATLHNLVSIRNTGNCENKKIMGEQLKKIQLLISSSEEEKSQDIFDIYSSNSLMRKAKPMKSHNRRRFQTRRNSNTPRLQQLKQDIHQSILVISRFLIPWAVVQLVIRVGIAITTYAALCLLVGQWVLPTQFMAPESNFDYLHTDIEGLKLLIPLLISLTGTIMLGNPCLSPQREMFLIWLVFHGITTPAATIIFDLFTGTGVTAISNLMGISYLGELVVIQLSLLVLFLSGLWLQKPILLYSQTTASILRLFHSQRLTSTAVMLPLVVSVIFGAGTLIILHIKEGWLLLIVSSSFLTLWYRLKRNMRGLWHKHNLASHKLPFAILN